MLQLGNLQLVQSTLLVPILGSFPYRRLEMSVLYTVFGAGWGGGMLTFLLELAHMVVRSINGVLSFSCTQGWYQGYQGWLSHHQTNSQAGDIFIYIQNQTGHMVKFSALTAVKSLQRNYQGRSPRREGWGFLGFPGFWGKLWLAFSEKVKKVKLTRKIHEKS